MIWTWRDCSAIGGVTLLATLWASPLHAALGEASMLAPRGTAKAFPLVAGGKAAAIHVSDGDWPGVIRAASDLQSDVEAVTGVRPALQKTVPSGTVVVAGTIGRSALIDGLVGARKLDVTKIRGRWEAFQVEVVDKPLPGVARALVIAGSDKRGTIYGLYEISEQIGVSPWYYWADVPVRRSAELWLRPGRRIDPGPVVKYRGIFLNDEAPALSGWSKATFGGFNSRFYAHVFELILRLRGNYLWPAMWGNAFADDDRDSPRLADAYGIVMGTSHHEPLMRAHDEWRRYGKGPWDYAQNDETLRAFWRGGIERVKGFESIVSLGMRGDGDMAMSAETNVALLERIVADQRTILTDVNGKPATEIPQLWALYKEVQEYYERGMRVPDDVTLLWCDDNWGNIRRLPTPAERSRPGGAGIYYHFDYVGGPRNYKWLNTVPITKVWEQMHLAWRYGADRLWIVNVGDLKPMEFPIEFFLRYAWDPARWPYESLGDFSRNWAAREFGSTHATEIAALVNGYTKLNGRRKPEMLAPDTYSLVHYREAERVLEEWRSLVARAEAVNAALPASDRDAFFQLVLYPVKASANLQELYVAAGLNRLYARQGRAAANDEADRARRLFARDAELADTYHALGGGKWKHMMSQVKLGYTYWQQPPVEAMPEVTTVRPLAGAAMGAASEGATFPGGGGGGGFRSFRTLPPLDRWSGLTRWIDVFNRGTEPFTFTVETEAPWLTVAPASGTIERQTRLEVAADWARVPADAASARVTVRASTGETIEFTAPVESIAGDPGDAFVETAGVVAIEAPHFHRAIAGPGIEWKALADFGRTFGGVTSFPVTAAASTPGGAAPRVEYDFLTHGAGEIKVELHFAPSLDFQPGDGLRFAVSVDDEPPQTVKLGTWTTQESWNISVGDGVRRVTSTHRLAAPGRHVLKIWRVDAGVVLQRIVIDRGGLKPSYLGPPESPRTHTSAAQR